MTIESELRVASDRLLRTLDQIQALESEKRTIKPDSERFQRLAREIERLAAEAYAHSHAQQQLGQQAKAVADRSGVEMPSIDASTGTRPLHVILSDWRDAERRLQLAPADSAEHAAAAADVGRLREEYHAAYVNRPATAKGN